MSARKNVKVVYALWWRETVRFARERSRWLSLLLQPLLYLTLVGYGIASAMRFKGGGSADYLAFMYPGILGMSILFMALFSAISILWDREFGFLKEVLVAPAPRWAAAAGKALGIATVAVLQTAALLILAPIAHLSLGPISIVGTLLVAALDGFVIGCLGIFVAGQMQSMESFQLVINMFAQPMFFLSGALYPLSGLPGWLAALASVDPLAYGVDALRNTLYAGDEQARALIQHPLYVDVGVLGALAVVAAAAAAWSFSRQQS